MGDSPQTRASTALLLTDLDGTQSNMMDGCNKSYLVIISGHFMVRIPRCVEYGFITCSVPMEGETAYRTKCST